MNISTLTQDIINAVINTDVEMDVMLQASRSRQIERIEKSRESFETAINVLAINNSSDRNFKKACANKSDLWNGRIQYTMYKSDTEKLQPMQDAPKASIKASIKHIPSSRKFEGVADSSKDFKPSLKSFKSYTVENYHFYNKAIVLELTDPEKARESYQNRELAEKNPEVIHLVFRYMPFTRTGKPNPYDGITQLRDFLKSQKFLVSQNPSNLREALDILVGYTVDFPNIYSYNNTTKSDLLTVYSVYGDFSQFEVEFSK